MVHRSVSVRLMLILLCAIILLCCFLEAFSHGLSKPYGLRKASICTRQAPHVCCVNGPCNGLPRVVPEAAEGMVPRPGSRRWGRAQYFSGNISLEELCCFYAEHPYDLTDPDR